MATLEGLDVSRWQGTTPNLAGKAFLFARATYGAIRDQMYSTHIANARKAGLLVGAYHFGVGDVPVPSQVSAFLAAAGTVDFYVLDLESNGGRPSMTLGQASLFIALVRAKNHKIGLYHSDSGFPLTLGQSYNWVAKWSVNPPTHPWTFWQYRGSPLDLDRFNGDEAKLQALAGNAGPVRLRVCSGRSSTSRERGSGDDLPEPDRARAGTADSSQQRCNEPSGGAFTGLS